jgi:hypothetical protein
VWSDRRRLQHRGRLLREGHQPHGEESEPEIFNAIRYGSVLENVVYDKATRDRRLHEHLDHREHALQLPDRVHPEREDPLRRKHPNNVILLTCRRVRRAAAGQQADARPGDVPLHLGLHGEGRRHRDGREGPRATFSACFGAAFMVWHPTKYAELLAAKIKPRTARRCGSSTRAGPAVPYGVGQRMSLKYTRAILDAIHDGSLAKAPTGRRPDLRPARPTACANVPSEILIAEEHVGRQGRLRRHAGQEARQVLFIDNFKKYCLSSHEAPPGCPARRFVVSEAPRDRRTNGVLTQGAYEYALRRWPRTSDDESCSAPPWAWRRSCSPAAGRSPSRLATSSRLLPRRLATWSRLPRRRRRHTRLAT